MSSQACLDGIIVSFRPTQVSSQLLSRKPSQTEVSPSEAFRSLTPPPSSEGDMHDRESSPAQASNPKSNTDAIIARLMAEARAAVHSSPEQSPIDLNDLSGSDSDSSDEDSEDAHRKLVAELMNAPSVKDKTSS